MQKITKQNQINRIIDANINRAKEGLRVCEDIARFLLDNRGLTNKLKNIRHKINTIQKMTIERNNLISFRNSKGDIGKTIYNRELKRESVSDIFYANIQRAKESMRVLEEFSKLINKESAIEFKTIRYELYAIEKNAYSLVSGISCKTIK